MEATIAEPCKISKLQYLCDCLMVWLYLYIMVDRQSQVIFLCANTLTHTQKDHSVIDSLIHRENIIPDSTKTNEGNPKIPSLYFI